MSESLILLHGFGSTGRLWDAVVECLQPERYKALALDLPGHGSQARAPHPITFDSCVDHVLANSPERFTLAGYSMGGRIALHVALAAPERIDRLVLVSCTAGIEDPTERGLRRAQDRSLAAEVKKSSIEDFVERWRGQSMFADDPPSVDAAARREMLQNTPAGVAAALRGIGTGEMQPLWRRLPELAMPVTIVVGERDAKFRPIAARMAELIPNGWQILLGGGHVLPLEAPAELAEIVEALPRVDRRPGPRASAPGCGPPGG